ncbi:MAG: DNA alkylation repair protein [Candidatus Aminicenantes bacterium]|nr:DNA alkylation repair protein [Candidatus Aminicenantes bacterium]
MNKSIPSPRRIAEEAARLYRAKANPARAAQAQKYFKDRVRCFGLSSPEAREIAAGLYLKVKGAWSAAEAVALGDIVFRRPELEFKGLGALMLLRFKKGFPKSLFDKIKGWLAADLLDNWASVDILCPDAVGALLVAYPELRTKIKAWAVHPNLWVRRGSLVSYIKLAKRAEFTPKAYAMARAHFGSRDDLIHKATGWLLREAGKADMGALEAFLRAHGPAVPRTALRYAIERFPAAKRRALLEATRKKERIP